MGTGKGAGAGIGNGARAAPYLVAGGTASIRTANMIEKHSYISKYKFGK